MTYQEQADKLATLTEDWGYYDAADMVEDYIFEGVMPSICMEKGCDYTTEMEPDQTHGWCEVCGSNSVTSAAILLGVI